MNKRFLLEQCKRARVVTEDEMRLYADTNNTWWINHQKGHLYLIEALDAYLNSKDCINKKQLRQLLKKKIAVADNIINELDKKYDYFQNELEIDPDDEYIYSLNDGISCEGYQFRKIINKQKYYDKKSYEKTDWKKLGFIK